MDHTKPWLKYVPASAMQDATLELRHMKVRNNAAEDLGRVDGFVVNESSGSPRYLVVDAGGWLNSKQFLVPIGQVHLERDREALLVPLSKEQITHFPGFDLDEFKTLSDQDIERLNAAHNSPPPDVPAAAGPASRADAAFDVPDWWNVPADRAERDTHSQADGS